MLIEIGQPKQYDYIGAKFTISGWVDLLWFKNDTSELDWRIFVDYLGLDARTYIGATPHLTLEERKPGDNLYFI